MRSLLKILSFNVVLCALFGCMATFDNLPPPAPLHPIPCVTDADCSVYGRNCQHQICVDGPKKAQARLSIVVHPPAERQDLAPRTWRDQQIRFSDPHYFSLAPLVSVQGVVSQKGHSGPLRVQLFFSRQGDVAGRRFTQSLASDDNGNFATLLPEGDYTVSIHTEWEDFPEHITTMHVSRENQSGMTYVDLPANNEFIRWTGRLIRLDNDLATRPVEGVTIWAMDTNSSLQSSLAVTNENGVFSVYLHKSVTEFRMYLRARAVTDGGEHFLIPATTFSPLLAPSLPDDAQSSEIPGYELLLGVLQPSVRVSGIVLDSENLPVAGARVMAQARLNPMGEDSELSVPERATLEARTTTELDGSYTLLFPEQPDVRLTAFAPDRPSKISDQTNILNLIALNGQDSGPHLIRLSPPAELELTVTDASGHTVDDYEARFSLEDSEYLSARNFDASVEEFSLIYLSHARQRAHMLVSEGLWHLNVRPREDLTLPNAWVSASVSKDQNSLHVTIPRGVAARLVLHDEAGEPLRGATVELWQEFSSEGLTKASEPRMLGTAQTNAMGETTILAPYSRD